MRLFTAIELSDPARRHLSGVQAQLKGLWAPGQARNFPPVSWTREGNLHVTLKFLGEVADEQVPRLREALSRVEFPRPALDLRAEALDVFPSRGSIRVIHAQVGGDVERLAAAHDAIEAQCASIGFPRENRRFRAHVTMGRPRAPLRGAWEALQAATDGMWPGPAFEASRFALVQSRLNPAGAIYTNVATFPEFR
jgi:2'-5' RNA ligase